MEAKMKAIVENFAIDGTVVEVRPFGNGLINTSFQVVTQGDAPDYVLQNVNVAIFPDMDLLMNNINNVTTHIRQKLETNGVSDVDRKVLRFYPTHEGKYYHFDGEKYWRVMLLIPDTISKTGVSLESAAIVGETFANFQAMLADIPHQLGETIKDFHNIEWRLQQLKDAVRDNKAGRLDEPEALSLIHI